MGVSCKESNEKLKRNVDAINSGAAHPIHNTVANVDENGNAIYQRFYGRKFP